MEKVEGLAGEIAGDSARRQTPQLGLVCITSSDKIRYRTITRKRLLSFPEPQQVILLRELYEENIERLQAAIDYCRLNRLFLYRMTSALFPFADCPVGEEALGDLKEHLQQTGELAKAAGIRLVLHPDQYVVLSSDREEVIANSVKILEMHARTMDLLALPRTPWAAVMIHGGKGGRAERLERTIEDLPEAIRSRLALENDERAYGAKEILEVCKRTGVPMVFDAHHHVCHEGLDSYDHPSVAEMLAAARATWDPADWQLVHISNGRKSFSDCAHSDVITLMPECYRNAPWIEVEAKAKEAAIYQLRDTWLSSIARDTGATVEYAEAF